jgi:putative Mg2+ transporter-C (MgtC) family protein
MLVAVGPALFTIASAYGFHDFLVSGDAVVRADPTRIAAQIVTGIGFLGAGAIIRQGLAVRGLTTAATLWWSRRSASPPAPATTRRRSSRR